MALRVLKYIIFLLVAVCTCGSAGAQILVNDGAPMAEDSVRRDFSDQPYFGIYKDNYFIFGPSIGPRPTNKNTNVKFQISVAQRLTRTTLPGGTYLYLFYSQKCFWNVLENSMPMTDLNFNPGIGLTRPLFVKNRYIGKLTLMIEHESNGRDSIWSRSWNRISLAAHAFVTKNLMVHAKTWIPIVDGENNRDLLDYVGVFQYGCQYISNNRRFCAGITIVPRKRFLSCNTVVDFAVRLFRRENQYLLFQFYNGYGEGLLDYNKFHSQIRVGLLIKPKLFSDY